MNIIQLKSSEDFLKLNNFFKQENPTWATPYKLCAVLGLPSTSENIWIAEQEIDYAFWGEC